MDRRIISALDSSNTSQIDRALLQTFIKDHFLHEYYTPLSFTALKPHLILNKYTAGDTLYQQGQYIDSYLYLVEGRVLFTQDRCLVDAPMMLGQPFQCRQSHRERTAKVISPEATILIIKKQPALVVMRPQIQELDFIMQELAAFIGVKVETLERAKLAPLVRLEKYRLKEQVRVKERVGYLIVEGECRVSCRRKEVVLTRPNCLAVSAYFKQINAESIYSAYSTELQLLAFSYDAISLLPSAFQQILRFLHQAHQPPFEESPLPKLQRQPNSSLHSYSGTPRFSHKVNKSSSVCEADEGTMAELQSFRKHFVLGYYSKQAAITAQGYVRQQIKEPKGYFEMRGKTEVGKEGQPARRREWATYLHAKSQEKAKKGHQHGNLKPKHRKENSPTLSPKHHLLADIFNRYHNLPSLLPKRSTTKAGKSRQFRFNHQQQSKINDT